MIGRLLSTISAAILVTMLNFGFCQAQKKGPNVLSYYAVTNSIDGQPLIDKTNVLRFYPVFALRDSIEFVKVTVYYGNKVSIQEAVKLMNGLYWESRLPTFDLGDGIQRYEVETGMTYDINVTRSLDDYAFEIQRRRTELNDTLSRITSDISSQRSQVISNFNSAGLHTSSEFDSLKKMTLGAIDKLLEIQKKNIERPLKQDIIGALRDIEYPSKDSLMKYLTNEIIIQYDSVHVSEWENDTLLLVFNDDVDILKLKILVAENSNSIIPEHHKYDTLSQSIFTNQIWSDFDDATNSYENDTLKIINDISSLIDSLESHNNVYSVKSSVEQYFQTYSNSGIDGLNEYIESINKLISKVQNASVINTQDQKALFELIASQEFLLDSLKGNLIRQLSDKEFSGVGIQKSDILYYDEYTKVKILYRNYRRVNRTLVALDPAEKLGIFRLRYVPFPIIGTQLEGPAKSGIPVVFEAGITFGNQVITSNEFLTPEFSLKRLGIAVAFTPQLFSEDADILALLFTYDFNAYASLGVGANFGRLESDSDLYISLGINQRAFKALVSGIGNVFSK